MFRRLGMLAAAVLILSAPATAVAKDSDEVERQSKPKLVQIKVSSSASEDPTPANPFGPSPKNFRAKLLQLRQIAADEEIDGVVLKVSGAPDYARSLDLMTELRAVKAAGKKVVCYSETLDQRSLTFASLADLLAMPPSGGMSLDGLMAEVMYMKNLFALLDVKFDVIHIGNFKTAFEDFSKDRMSDEQRKVTEILLQEFLTQMQEMIAENRGLTVAKVEEAYQKLMFQPQEAMEFGLIDAVVYEDQFDDEVDKLFGGEVDVETSYGDESMEDLEKMLESPFAMFQMLPKLLNPEKKKLPAEPRIAIVYATGPIMSGKSQVGFDGSVASMGSETIVEALEAALEDDWVRAVILRVNSPGGSALASDMIWRATQRVKAKKPIISSMGGVAASGGYWISMGCDRIIAQPSTITGSIGVVGMLPDFSSALKRFGVNVEVVGAGPHVDDLAMMRDGASPMLKELIHDGMLDVYGEFIRKVAEGRKMNPTVLETLARGRVWTGRQAADLNLVDELGGLDRAIEIACELGGGLDKKTIGVAEYPMPRSLFEQLEESFEGMITIEGQVKRMLCEAGYSDLVVMAEQMLAKKSTAIGPDNIQVVLPYQLRIR